MSIPITLTIKRKTKTPNKRQVRHLYRWEWRLVDVLYRPITSKIFKTIDDGFCETEAQFMKYIKNQYGEGIYLILLNRKGMCGFKSFTKFELKGDRFRRLRKNPHPKEREIKEYEEDIEMLEEKKKKDKSKDIDEEISIDQEIIQDIKEEIGEKSRYYISYYLKASRPVYSWHSYEDYGNNEESEKEVRLF